MDTRWRVAFDPTLDPRAAWVVEVDQGSCMAMRCVDQVAGGSYETQRQAFDAASRSVAMEAVHEAGLGSCDEHHADAVCPVCGSAWKWTGADYIVCAGCDEVLYPGELVEHWSNDTRLAYAEAAGYSPHYGLPLGVVQAAMAHAVPPVAA